MNFIDCISGTPPVGGVFFLVCAPSEMENCAADVKDWCSYSVRDKKMRITRKETVRRFRSKQENENYTEEVSQYVPYKTRKCESRGRNQPIGSVQNKKIRISRKKSANRFRAKQENANRAEGTSPWVPYKTRK